MSFVYSIQGYIVFSVIIELENDGSRWLTRLVQFETLRKNESDIFIKKVLYRIVDLLMEKNNFPGI